MKALRKVYESARRQNRGDLTVSNILKDRAAELWPEKAKVSEQVEVQDDPDNPTGSGKKKAKKKESSANVNRIFVAKLPDSLYDRITSIWDGIR